MTSGAKTRNPECVRRLVAGAALALAALPALAFDLPELMALLARQKSGEAHFTEERHVKGLDFPLQASGTLSFTAPDRFARRTLKPKPEAMVVEGNTVTLSRGNRSRTVALDATPEAAVAVESVRATLTGNASALQRYFKVTLAGDAERWTLELVPRELSQAGPLRSVRIVGQRQQVRMVETHLADGDRSVMTIEPVAAAPAAPARQ
ncbi:MAG: outer membrane lipoprotein carrier protein LolA [Pseudomonadota bacterium]